MAKRTRPKELAKPISVGMYPSEVAFLRTRANLAGSISRYLRLLVAYDQKHNVFAAVLKSQIEEGTER